jgi:hypothetical protein
MAFLEVEFCLGRRGSGRGLGRRRKNRKTRSRKSVNRLLIGRSDNERIQTIVISIPAWTKFDWKNGRKCGNQAASEQCRGTTIYPDNPFGGVVHGTGIVN